MTTAGLQVTKCEVLNPNAINKDTIDAMTYQMKSAGVPMTTHKDIIFRGADGTFQSAECNIEPELPKEIEKADALGMLGRIKLRGDSTQKIINVSIPEDLLWNMLFDHVSTFKKDKKVPGRIYKMILDHFGKKENIIKRAFNQAGKTAVTTAEAVKALSDLTTSGMIAFGNVVISIEKTLIEPKTRTIIIDDVVNNPKLESLEKDTAREDFIKDLHRKGLIQ